MYCKECHFVLFFQLKFYARSGQPVGAGRDLIAEAHYALAGQYVSNVEVLPTSMCGGTRLFELNNIKFLNEDIEFVHTALLIPYYSMFAISFVIYWLIMFSAYKFIKGEAVVDHQSVPFFIGFLISTSTFGLAIFLAEMVSFPWYCVISVHAIPGIACLLLVVVSLPVIHLLVFVKMRCCGPYTCSTSLKLLLSAFISTFVFIWLFICAFPTLLLGFSYPLKTLSLFVLHVAFVFAVTIAFAVGLRDITFWSNLYWTNRKILEKNKIKEFCFVVNNVLMSRKWSVLIIILVWIGGLLVYGGIMIGYAVTVAQGFVTADGASAVVYLVPSFVLFLMGWLIKRRFFSDTGKWLKINRNDINQWCVHKIVTSSKKIS